MKESILREKTKSISVKVLKLCDEIDTRKGKSVLINQIVKSSTSIGANINEANYASSRADFINKLHISLKECFETEYWLDILKELDCVPIEKIEEIKNECGVVRKILVKSINTAKENENE